jgi:hypothetical protein
MVHGPVDGPHELAEDSPSVVFLFFSFLLFLTLYYSYIFLFLHITKVSSRLTLYRLKGKKGVRRLESPYRLKNYGCMCPNHLKRCCTSFSSTGVTPSLSRMSSFRIRSLLVWLQIHRSMRISATLSYWTCLLLVDQHSAPYNMVGRIAVL